MTIYQFKAINGANEIFEGQMEGGDTASVVERLQDMGNFPIQVRRLNTADAIGLQYPNLVNARSPSKQTILDLTRNTATLLAAGLPLDQAIRFQIKMANNENQRRTLVGILDAVRGGKSFADAVAEVGCGADEYVVASIRAGEASGALDEVLRRLSRHLEHSQKLHEKIKTALIYPAILLGMAVLSLIILVAFVIPEFQNLFDDAEMELPRSTQAIITMSNLAASYWWLLATLLLISFVSLRLQLNHPRTRYHWDKWILRLPLFGAVMLNARISDFGYLMSNLVQNGVPLLRSLQLSKAMLRNLVLMEALDNVVARVREGCGLAESLRENGMFPELAIDLIEVGEESGRLDSMLQRVGSIYGERVEHAVSRLVAILVPTLTIGIGVVIAGVIASILVAILSINQLAV